MLSFAPLVEGCPARLSPARGIRELRVELSAIRGARWSSRCWRTPCRAMPFPPCQAARQARPPWLSRNTFQNKKDPSSEMIPGTMTSTRTNKSRPNWPRPRPSTAQTSAMFGRKESTESPPQLPSTPPTTFWMRLEASVRRNPAAPPARRRPERLRKRAGNAATRTFARRPTTETATAMTTSNSRAASSRGLGCPAKAMRPTRSVCSLPTSELWAQTRQP